MTSSSSAISVTREEFNAFHTVDRALFTRLVLALGRDITESLQVMSFLLYLEKSGLVRHLIANLAPFPDAYINELAQEVVLCMTCLACQDFATFVANSGQIINSFTIPWIRQITLERLTLPVIHQKRETILLDMNKHLTGICYPAFEDICLRAEMYNKEKMLIAEMNQLGITSGHTHKGESSSSFVNDLQETNKFHNGLVASEEQVMAEARTVFLTFSKGYPISEAEVYNFFTSKFGDIIEAIYMRGGDGNEQALFARMVLRSSTKIPEIVTVSDGTSRTKYTINGKHVWARKFIPKYSNLPSSGVSL